MSRSISLLGRYLAVALMMSLLSVTSFSQPMLTKALDFDGDGKADYGIFRPSQNGWWILLSTGSHMFQQWGLANEDRIVPGDYDGDGRADIAVFRDAPAQWWVLRSSDFTHTFNQWGVEGDEPVQRDYDGDNKTDIAVVRRTGGYMYWWVLYSGGGHAVMQWGLDSDYVCPGSYDDDNKFDYCVQRRGPTPSSQSYFHIWGSQAGHIAYQWGLTSDYVAPGDYDGDGKTDIAVVRAGENPTDIMVWWILFSNGGGHVGVPFGYTGDDYIAQGDYNGDNRTEVAIFRPSTGWFYTIDPITAVPGGAKWGTEGDLPIAGYDTH